MSDTKRTRVGAPVIVTAPLIMLVVILLATGGPIQSYDFRHMLIWGVIVAALLGLLAVSLKLFGVREATAKINLLCGPLLIVLFWLHGVFFDPPNNWAMLGEYGFLGFWFKPHLDFRYRENIALSLSLSLPILIVFLGNLPLLLKRIGRAENSSKAIFALCCWYLCAALLHHIPDRALDVANHQPDHFRDLDLYKEFVLALILATPFFVSAAYMTRATVNRPPLP